MASAGDFHQEARHLDDWVRWIYREGNLDRLSEVYRSLPKVLDTMFEQWLDCDVPEVLADVLGLLLPGYADNLFAALWREEAKSLRYRFSMRQLPDYSRWLLKRRAVKSSVPQIYEHYKVSFEEGILELPMRDFFIFTFMHHATRRRGPNMPAWYEGQTFLSSLFTNPYLILFSQMLVQLDPSSLYILLNVTEEYIISPVSRRPLDYNQPWRLPMRHECELLIMMLYVLQSPLYLLTESHKIQSIRADAPLLTLQESFYLFFKNSSLHWSSEESYPAYMAEVWLRYLTPWRSSRTIDEFLAYDFLRGISKFDDQKQQFNQHLVYYSGSEVFWEDYVSENLLCYTELFEVIMKMLCGQLLMRSGDVDLLRRISDVFAVDEDGRTICGHLNIFTLDEMSHGAKLSPDLANRLRLYVLDPRVLSPFTNPQIKYIIETLYFKAGQMGSGLTAKIAQNWKHVFSLEAIQGEDQFPDGNDDSGKWRRPGEFPSTTVPVWQRPQRTDELWVLFQLAWGLAKVVDRCRGIEEAWPQTNLRFMASYLNLMYAGVALVAGYWLLASS